MSNSPKRATEAYVTETTFKEGSGWVVVSRFRGLDRVECGIILLDLYCLGVKNAAYTQLSVMEYDFDFLKRVSRGYKLDKIQPCCARKLIEGAVDYAKWLGFSPHADYKKASRVFGGISAEDCTETFTYGKDGKPFYIQGPYETEEQARKITQMLELKCGSKNFHFLMALGNNPKANEEFLADEAED